MEWISVGNLTNAILVVVGWSIQNELHHIRQSVKDLKDLITKAESTALRAHERIDFFLKHGLEK